MIRQTFLAALYGLAVAFALSTSAHAQNDEYYPRQAGSWGGKVRSGPGMQYGQIDGLNEGDPVTLLQNTGQWMNGYPWFRIRFKNGREGYKWGGILCAFDSPIPGVYKTCSRKNYSGNGAGPTNEFPLAAGSWGGVVRNGPGRQYGRIGTLYEGEPVTLLRRTNVVMNGYPWFEISFRSGQTGYKWGGILCATQAPVAGLFQRCNTSSSGNASPRPGSLHRVVKFARGRVSTNVNGFLQPNQNEVLSFDAQPGQLVHMSLSSSNGNITFSLHPGSARQSPLSPVTTNWSGKLAYARHYEILVNNRGAAADYSLVLEIR